MSIFKNQNESAFVGGRKHWTDVIKNSGPGELLLWRQPEEDFNTNSTLIVMPGEEAIFINGGNIKQVFTSGTYKLNTNNYPFISRLRNAFSGGISTFNCVVYFVRKAVSMEIYWGTDSPIQVRDPIFQIACDVQARGSYKVSIEDSAKFLTLMIGNNVFLTTQAELTNFFRSQFLMHIKSNLAKAIKNSGEELIGINAQQDLIAGELSKIIAGVFDEYGIYLQVFSIESIDVVDNENRQKLEDAISSKGVMGILGDNWERQKQYELMGGAVSNPGGLAGAGAGLGMGMGMGGAFAGMAGGMFNNQGGFSQGTSVDNPLERLNQSNNQPVNNAQSDEPIPQLDPVEILKKLKQMLDLNLITQEVYDEKLSEIMSRM